MIFMDCEMPEMDGYQATKKIRELEKLNGKQTPILALTAHALDEYLDKAIASGMDDFLLKPINADKLQSILSKYSAIIHKDPATKSVDNP